MIDTQFGHGFGDGGIEFGSLPLGATTIGNVKRSPRLSPDAMVVTFGGSMAITLAQGTNVLVPLVNS